jgi:steroid delta-isomerase-like uncharacterized protein
MKTTTDVGDIAQRFIQAWNAGQRHIVDECAAPDLVVSYPHIPEPLRSPEAFKTMLAQTHRYFPDLTIEVLDVVVDGSKAVVHWVYRGTFEEGEMFGVEASGQSVEVEGMSKYQIGDGQVRREEGLVDTFGLMMQLGAAPGKSKEE